MAQIWPPVPMGLVMKSRALSRGPDSGVEMAQQEEGSHVPLLHSSSAELRCGGGVVSRRKSVLGLGRVPQPAGQPVFQGHGLAYLLSLGEPVELTNPLQFSPTNPACSLGGCEPFFTESCTQLCLRETALAGCP